ncbi:hypothetical protein ACFSM5_02140 [Lacibacterium aquatile]|uniref:Uncharacterized protein n=1 Tax=Lacibacterium aquatile TaxID=1168082 RepID=A0ABW5DMI4_9PROT
MSTGRKLIVLGVLSLLIGGGFAYLASTAGYGRCVQREAGHAALDLCFDSGALSLLVWFALGLMVTGACGLMCWGLWAVRRYLPGERFTACTAILCVVGAMLLAAYGLGEDFWAIDSCLDGGGLWNYDERTCEGAAP